MRRSKGSGGGVGPAAGRRIARTTPIPFRRSNPNISPPLPSHQRQWQKIFGLSDFACLGQEVFPFDAAVAGVAWKMAVYESESADPHFPTPWQSVAVGEIGERRLGQLGNRKIEWKWE